MTAAAPRSESRTTAIAVRSALGWAIAALFGAIGILLLQIPGFPKVVAAQITAGTIGLVGGLSNASLIRSTGGTVSWKQGVMLSLAWALSCIIGITPPFFTSGIPLQMMVLTFYAFALSGALGGAATVVIIRSSGDDKDSFHFAPAVVIWSIGFGTAAIAATVVGEGLSMIMPVWIAWAIAFEAMALIIGSAGGYAIVKLLRTAGPARSAAEESNRSSRIRGNNRRSAIILLALCLPFYLNDLSDIYVTDWRLWILIDYVAVKLFPCFVIFWLIRNREMDFSDFGLNIPSAASFLTVFFIGALSGLFIEHNGYLVVDKLHGYHPLGGIPEIEGPLWKWIDLTAGLLMTGICEEMVFRGYLRTFLSRYTKRASVIILISALAFGLIHWSGGFSKVLVTSTVGAVFMLLYLRTSSLPAIMAAHFAINFVDYANFVPKYIFRFF